MPIRAGHKTIVTLPLSRETKWRFGTIFSGTVTGENVWALKRGKSHMSSSATNCVYITGIYENIFFSSPVRLQACPYAGISESTLRTPTYNLEAPPHSIFTF